MRIVIAHCRARAFPDATSGFSRIRGSRPAASAALRRCVETGALGAQLELERVSSLAVLICFVAACLA
jgi:hypothetical protein